MHRNRKRLILLTLVGFCLALGRSFAADGTGTVFIPNSIDNPTLLSVTLPNLDGSGFLRGTAADVTHPFGFGRASDAGLAFDFDPTVPGSGGLPSVEHVHFAETMAYYHIATYDAYVSLLGFGAAPSPTPVIVFNGTDFGFGLWSPAGTAYDSGTGGLSLSLTFGTVVEDTDALDGDLIIHEYAHAIQHRFLGGTPGVFAQPDSDIADQAQALMEGLADFAAGSWFDDPEIGEWFGVINFEPDQDFARTIENFRRWPDDLHANEQITGMVVSGAFWDLRSVIGASEADRLWLGLMSTMVDNNLATPELNTTYTEALTTLLTVAGGDVVLQDRISQAFAARGIGTYDFTTLFPMERDPGNNFDGTQVYTDPGATALVVQFDEFISRLDDSTLTWDEFETGHTIAAKTTVDQLVVLDGADQVVGTFAGRQLQSLQLLVLGDTVKFHLTTDADLAPFGYRVVDISPCANADLDLNVAAGSESVKPGDVVTVTLDVSNLSSAINGAQALIHYDDTLLTLTDITPEGSVGWIESLQTDVNGDITYWASINAGSTSVDGTIATLKFLAIAEGATNLTFWTGVSLVSKLTRFPDSTMILPCLGPSGSIVSACDDGLFCNGLETFVAGVCQPGTPIDCSSFTDDCNTGVCNETTDACEAQPVSDGPAGVGFCDDGNDCTQDNCLGGACDNDGTDVTVTCDDADACTTDDVCQGDAAGTCIGTDTSAVDCDDSVACTTDTCDSVTGCANTPVDLVCDDSNVCTADTCDPALGCVNDGTGITVACDDADVCTESDVCLAGVCAGVNVPRVTVNVEIDALDPAALTRDVSFRLTECAGPTFETRFAPVTFTSRTGTAVLDNIDPAAEWINVREGHTLGRLASLAFDACNHAVVDLTGVNRLLSGDFQTSLVPQDRLVDVTDLSILSAAWAAVIDPSLSSGADATGDGIQDTADHTALVVNATKTSNALDGCLGGRSSGGDFGVLSSTDAKESLCGDAAGDSALIDLSLGSRPRSIDVGAQFEIDLLMSAATLAGQDQSVAAMDVVVTWNPVAIELLEVEDTGSYDWLLTSPTTTRLPDPLNESFLDGDIRYTALAQLNDPVFATPEGMRTATLQFVALAELATSDIGIVPTLGESAATRVFGADCANHLVTGSLRGTAVSIIPPQDCEGDGVSDLREFFYLQSCFTGRAETLSPDGLPAYPEDPGLCCGVFDRDDDGDVDGTDYAYFARLMRGPQ